MAINYTSEFYLEGKTRCVLKSISQNLKWILLFIARNSGLIHVLGLFNSSRMCTYHTSTNKYNGPSPLISPCVAGVYTRCNDGKYVNKCMEIRLINMFNRQSNISLTVVTICQHNLTPINNVTILTSSCLLLLSKLKTYL